MLHLFGKGASARQFTPAAPPTSIVAPLRHPREPVVMAARSAARGGAAMLDRPDRGVFAIADAIGTRTGDAVAAAAVIDALAKLTDLSAPTTAAIRALLGRVDDAVRATRLDPRRSAGASVAVLHLGDRLATVLWAGDCRVYRYHDGALDLLTRDHSALHELIDAGIAVPARAGAHPHLVTRAIGLGPGLEIDTATVPVAAGDRLLLCARGLSSTLPATMISRRLRMPAAAAADALIEAASCMGAADGGPLIAIEVC